MMKDRNTKFKECFKNQGDPITPQQMFEMIGVIAGTVSQLQEIVGGMLQVQHAQNDSIETIAKNLNEMKKYLV